LAVISLLSVVWLAFKVWMVVDAIRRGVAYYWYFVFFFVPFGEFVYFAMVKADDFRLPRLDSLFQRPPSLRELRFRYQNTPSQENQLILAQALLRSGEVGEARELFGEIPDGDENPEVQYGLASCDLAQGNHARAIPMLERLVSRDPAYEDYAAWRALAQGLWASGRRDEGLASLRALAAKSPRLGHKFRLAQGLAEVGRKSEARRLLEEALLENRQAPAYIRRQNRLLVLKVNRFLAGLGSTDESGKPGADSK